MALNPRGRSALAGSALIFVMVAATAFIAYRFTAGAEAEDSAAARPLVVTAGPALTSAPTGKRPGPAEARAAIKAAVALLPAAKSVKATDSGSTRVLSPAVCARELNDTKADAAEIASSKYQIPQASEPDLRVTFTIQVRSGGTGDDAAYVVANAAEAARLCGEFIVDADGRHDVYRLSTYAADFPDAVRPVLQLRTETRTDPRVSAVVHSAVAGHGANSMMVDWSYAYHGSEPKQLTEQLDQTAAAMLQAGIAVLR